MAEAAKVTATREARRLSRQQDLDLHIGARMRERRISLGLTQKQMAALMGVTYQQAHEYETGVSHLSAAHLFYVAEALGVDIGYFFEGLHSGAQAFRATPEQRMLLELARNFISIGNRRQQEAVCALARALAGNDASSDAKSDDPDTRGIAAPVTFAIKLMDVWALKEKEAARLLGLEDEASLRELMSGAARLNTRDVKDRLRHLLRIREALHSLFRDIETEREWLLEPRPELNDRSPLALLLEGSMENFLVVSQFVQWVAGR